MTRFTAETRALHSRHVLEILLENSQSTLKQINAHLASKYNEQFSDSYMYVLRADAAKSLVANGKNIPKYAEPRSMAIRQAIREYRKAGRLDAEIVVELKTRGIEITLKNIIDIAYRMRREEPIPTIHERKKRTALRKAITALKEKPPKQMIATLKARGFIETKCDLNEFYKLRQELTQQDAIPAHRCPQSHTDLRKLLTANPNLGDEELLEKLEGKYVPSRQQLNSVKTDLRANGIPVPFKERPIRVVPYTPEQQAWLENNFKEVQRTIKRVCYQRGYTEEYADGFEHYVYSTLPIIMNRYNAQKFTRLDMLGFLKYNIRHYARGNFFMKWLRQKLGITSSESQKLTTLLIGQARGTSIEETAEKISVPSTEAQRLLGLYTECMKLANPLEFNPRIDYETEKT